MSDSIAVSRKSGRRWTIGGLLATGILINYFDRINISVAAPQLQHLFHLTPVELGVLFSAFFWSYSLCQIPGGMVLDRFGVTPVGRWGAFLWAAASFITAMAGGFMGIVIARILLGIAEAPAFPTCQKATGMWFPRKERSRSTAIFDSAAKFSNVIGVVIVAYAVVRWGWRWGFGITAILSFLYFVAFYVIYRDPSRDARLSKEEHRYIVEGGGTPEGRAATGQTMMLGYLLRNRKVWGVTIGFSAYGYSFYLFLSWLPLYLVHTMHMGILKSAFYTTIPWIFATLSDILIGGFFVDFLIARGMEESRARKIVVVGGMLVGLAVFGAMFTTNPDWALVWITVSLSGLSASAPVGSSCVSLIAPRGGTATIGGIVNFINNLTGIAAPVITGIVVGATGSFVGAFFVAGIVLIVGIVFYTAVLGRIEPIPEPGFTPDYAAGPGSAPRPDRA